tara:strand:- start:1843 stop:2214 length:372 start_codon:yes stop_codon:yes gene_type:complete
MSESPPPDPPSGTYSITVADAKEIYEECHMQLGILEDLIGDQVDVESINRNTFALLCESYQTSYKITSISDRILQENQRSGDGAKEEVIINGTDMIVLQTAMMARYYIGLDLVRNAGISTAIH